MLWNWQLPVWPRFHYEKTRIAQLEKKFLLEMGSVVSLRKNIHEEEYKRFIVEILSQEGLDSAKIEGELLDRASLQSSIKKHFGLDTSAKPETKKEARMAKLLCDVYETFDEPLTHEMLWKWHSRLFPEQGKYRTHKEPMQIVAQKYGSTRVFFEAPPSGRVHKEMHAFIAWFNASQNEAPLGRAALAHVYFECIHPFEDGNGRIGRALVEKVLSQSVERPVLIAVSEILEKRKKEYYAALEKCNRTLEISDWVEFFALIILQAQEHASCLLNFLLQKSVLLNRLAGTLNPRQEKALLRMFAEGPAGFQGGLYRNNLKNREFDKEGAVNLNQAKPALKQPNLHKLGDAGGFKVTGWPTQSKPDSSGCFGISAENYTAITKAPRATATRDLADLVQKGALIKTGELRHTRYWLNLK